MKGKGFYILFISIVIILGIVYILFYKYLEKGETITIESQKAEADSGNRIDSEDKTAEEKILYVQICGAVKREGVYQVPEGTRVFEAVELAGGLTEEAASHSVNQARLVKDGEMIYFPTLLEASSSLDNYSSNGLININLATKEQLMTLPGVGEAKAESILRYRESEGPFERIEDIMKVDGIKEGLFNSIEAYITI